MFEIINELFDDKINEFNNKLNVIDTSYSKYKVLKDKIRLVMENYNNLLNISISEIENIGYKLEDNDKLYLDSYKKIIASSTYDLGDYDKGIIKNILSKVNTYIVEKEFSINNGRNTLIELINKYKELKEKLPTFNFNGKDMQEIYELLSRLDDKEYAIEIMKFIAINSVNRFNNKEELKSNNKEKLENNTEEELKSNNEEKLENNTEEVIENNISNDELVMLFNKYGVDYNLFDDRAKDNFLKYGNLNIIESNLIAFKNNGYSICDAYAKYYGYQISEILIYSNSETINSVFNILKDTNSMVLTNKLFTYPNVFYDKEALRKLYRDKNISVFYGNEDFIKNIKLFDSYKCDINKLMIKSFMYFTISNEVIKSGIKNLELYSVDIKKGLRNLSCFATNNQADNMDKFIELGCFDYAVNNVSRLSIPVDSLIFYKLKFIKQNGININEYAYGTGLSSSITYDNKEFRLGDNTIKDKESARTLTRTYTMPIIKGSIYEKCEELLIKDNNNDVNIIFKLESKLIDLLDKKYLVYEDDGIDRIPNTRLYNVNGVNVSRYKVLRYLNTLRKNNIEIDSNILTYVMNRNSINTYAEFNLIKDEITRLYSDTKERSV